MSDDSQKIRIALGDLHHNTIGRHSPYFPLGIGCIASYTLAQHGAENISIRLFVDPVDMMDTLKHWKPDIVGITNYVWNSEVSSLLFRFAKDQDPSPLCIAGGPNISNRADEQLEFLRNHPEIDHYVLLEGETAFSHLVGMIIEDGSECLAEKAGYLSGLVTIDSEGRQLITGPENPRLKDLDVIPSPYLTGLFDKFFDGKMTPTIETARGCPFQCTFCVQGDMYFNSMAKFSLERTRNELYYIAERISTTPISTLQIVDSNFGSYKKDVEGARVIRETQDQFGWPVLVGSATGKAHIDRVIEASSIMKNSLEVATTFQSNNPETLSITKRRNIATPDGYSEIVEKLRSQGQNPSSELILPLPEETRQSYFDGIRALMESNISAEKTYTTMMLPGTVLDDPEVRKTYAMETRYRMLPWQFGEYDGRRCFEIEEVCVQTSTMSFEEYLECRDFALIVAVFSSKQFDIVRRLVEEHGLSFFDYLMQVSDRTKMDNSSFLKVLCDHLHEAEEELFTTREELISHYEQDESYRQLIDGSIGDNLLRKYCTIMIYRGGMDILNLAFDTLYQMLSDQSVDGGAVNAIRDASRWAVAVRDFSKILEPHDVGRGGTQLKLSYDVPRWYDENSGQNLVSYAREVEYDIYFDQDNVDKTLNESLALVGERDLFRIGVILKRSASSLWRQSVERVPELVG